MHSARTSSLAGAGHAAPLLNDALFLNPSYISFLKTYSIELDYHRFDASSAPAPYGRNYGISLQDGKTALVQAGLGYTVKENGSQLNLAAAKAFWPNISIGIGAKFFFNDIEGRDNPIDAVLSATYLVTPYIQVALVANNLLKLDGSRGAGWEREIIVGSKFNIEGIFLVYVDPHYTLDPSDGEVLGYEAGGEISIFHDFMLRAGHFMNVTVPFQTERATGFSLGGGWIGPRFAIDYGLTRVFESLGSLPESLAHQFTATLYF